MKQFTYPGMQATLAAWVRKYASASTSAFAFASPSAYAYASASAYAYASAPASASAYASAFASASAYAVKKPSKVEKDAIAQATNIVQSVVRYYNE